MNNKQTEAIVSVVIAMPVFFLIRSNWVIGGILVLCLLACYLKMDVFLKLRKEIKGFPFLAWGYSVASALVGFVISANPEFYEVYKPVFVVFLLLILVFMIKPYKEMRHYFKA